MNFTIFGLSVAIFLGSAHLADRTTNDVVALVSHEPTTSISEFHALKNMDRAILTWTIDKNVGASSVAVERSANNKDFTMVALVFCSEETGASNYNYTDRLKGKNYYYRLKLIAKDGTTTYSNPVMPQQAAE